MRRWKGFVIVLLIAALCGGIAYKILFYPVPVKPFRELMRISLGALGRASMDRTSAIVPMSASGYASQKGEDVRLGKTLAAAVYVAGNAKSNLRALPALSTTLLNDSQLAVDGWGKPFCVMQDGDVLLVVSGEFTTDIKCKSLRFPHDELIVQPRGRLVRLSPDTLVFSLNVQQSK